MGLSTLRQVGLSKARVEALTDGIFATVMTVLVLGRRTPIAYLSESELRSQVLSLWPNIVAYAFSFVVLGLFWIGHHNQFHYIKQTNRIFLWVNIVFLLTIGFMPFSTSLIGLYPFSPTDVRVYGANLAATGIMLNGVWWYATPPGQLTREGRKQLVKEITEIVTKIAGISRIAYGKQEFAHLAAKAAAASEVNTQRVTGNASPSKGV